MAAPTFQAAGTAAIAANAAVSPAWPAHTTDDIALLLIEGQSPGNLVKRTSAISNAGNGGGNSLFTGVKELAGSSGTTQVTLTVSAVNAMMTVALKPSGATPPSFQAAGSQVGSTGAATVAWPTHVTDDIALLVVETANESVSLSTPAGFVEVTGSPAGLGTAGATGATRVTLFWCRATSSTMTSPVVADAGDHVIARIYTFRGCIATGNPWDVTATDTNAVASTTSTCPAVTTTVDNTLVCFFCTNDFDGAGDAVSGWVNDGGLGIYLSDPQGFVALPSVPQVAGAYTAGDATALAVYWCRATSSAMAAPTIESLGDHVYTRIVTFRGCVNTGNPWNAVAGGVNYPVSTSATLPALTTDVVDTLIVLLLSSGRDGTGTWTTSMTNASLSTPTRRSEALTKRGTVVALQPGQAYGHPPAAAAPPPSLRHRPPMGCWWWRWPRRLPPPRTLASTRRSSASPKVLPAGVLTGVSAWA